MADKNKKELAKDIAKLEKDQLALRKLYTTALDRDFVQRKIMELQKQIDALKKMQ